MKIVLTFFLMVTFTLHVSAQELQGKVTSAADSLPIEGVHIVNTSQNKMAISDEKGTFSLSVIKGDTLVASNINFNSKQFVVGNAEYLRITLNPAVIQLDEVRVSNLPETEADFRRKLVDMGEVENDNFVPFGMKPNKPKSKIPINYDPTYNNSLKYAVTKPISFLVKKISKEHKNKVKYYETVANQGNKIVNDKKYNPEIVKDLTGLEGDDLTDFIHFLNIDPAFVKRSSEYEIAAHILKEFEVYKTGRG
ncbi:carboxypeptidase-like regulatory domain-containing protein [uncultured Marivirga sp.]|uniref:carboxypeptidase-like regulatory domain-containing protein n=1 Tax=uncultured Marivirga sp. TaxID=1123707 RepID=UPI0030EBA93A|tara:strand:+ start:445378 stop:446130 length:753 start_codon:yes stop_codon:yes gene_type:complete